MGSLSRSERRATHITFNLKPMNKLKQIVNTVEFGDEMLKLTKQYDALCRIADKLEEAQELMEKLQPLNIKCENAQIQNFAKKHPILAPNSLKDLQSMIDKTHSQITLTSAKVQELFNFQKLGNVIQLIKNANS